MSLIFEIYSQRVQIAKISIRNPLHEKRSDSRLTCLHAERFMPPRALQAHV